MVQKIGRGGNERGEEEKEEKEEDEEEDEEDEEDEQEEEDEKDERGRGQSEEESGGEGRGGGESVENLVRGDSFKAKAKLNQNKAKSTKHAGRPADFHSCPFNSFHVISSSSQFLSFSFSSFPFFSCHIMSFHFLSFPFLDNFLDNFFQAFTISNVPNPRVAVDCRISSRYRNQAETLKAFVIWVHTALKCRRIPNEQPRKQPIFRELDL